MNTLQIETEDNLFYKNKKLLIQLHTTYRGKNRVEKHKPVLILKGGALKFWGYTLEELNRNRMLAGVALERVARKT